MKLPVGTLTKLQDNFEGGHPNFIREGYEKKGIYDTLPKVGEPFWIHDMRTSTVTEICTHTSSEIIFKTSNSTYKLEFDKND